MNCNQSGGNISTRKRSPIDKDKRQVSLSVLTTAWLLAALYHCNVGSTGCRQLITITIMSG
ncbi:hypothetical protein J6590_021111 [Homalodisca vitripennis]|nr:hypothetical protein J6590_021111 [Homalodisca vitripennis]